MPHPVAQVLDPAGHVQRPHVVTEVALDLAGDRRYGVGLEGVAARRVVVVDGLDETEGGHLVQVLQGLAPAAETDGDPLGHGQPGLDQLVAQGLALGPLGQPRETFERRGGVGGVVVGVRSGAAGDTHDAHLPEQVPNGQTPWEARTRTSRQAPGARAAPTDVPPVRSTSRPIPGREDYETIQTIRPFGVPGVSGVTVVPCWLQAASKANLLSYEVDAPRGVDLHPGK